MAWQWCCGPRRGYAGSITAVVSVADDGGSSGRLRRDLGVPAPGDLRKCLVALASDDSVWRAAFEHRFEGGELGGHALGNLIIVGLAETLGDFGAAVDEAGRLLRDRRPGGPGDDRAVSCSRPTSRGRRSRARWRWRTAPVASAR